MSDPLDDLIDGAQEFENLDEDDDVDETTDNVVRFPIETQERDTPTVLCLGYDREFNYYYSSVRNQVIALTPSQHKKQYLMSLAPLAHWAAKAGNDGKILWDHWVNELNARCWNAGFYNPNRARGRGAWYDKGRIVFHIGDRLIVDGGHTRVQDFESWHIYEAGPQIPPPDLEHPLTATEARFFLKLAQRFRWAKRIHAYLVAGWCVVAPICGSLQWRPHIWITGGAGTGKTTVATGFIRPLLRKEIGHYFRGSSSKSGVEQTLHTDALPILFDEAESEGRRAQERIEEILTLMRESSSESGAETVKGTAIGQPRRSTVRSCFSLVSINLAGKSAADDSRITTVSLMAAPDATEPERAEARQHWEELQRDLLELSPDLVERLQARIVRMVPTIRRNAEVFGKAVALSLGNQRIGDQIGTLLAGAWALYSNDVVPFDEAKKWIESQDWSDAMEGSDDKDEERCLRHLMTAIVRATNEDQKTLDRSIAELVQMAVGDDYEPDMDRKTAGRNLRRHGLRVDEDVLFVSNRSPVLSRIFRETPWAGNWRRPLQRLPFAVPAERPARFQNEQGATHLSRATCIPVREALQFVF